MLFVIIEKAIEEFKAGNEKEAMKILYKKADALNSVFGEYKVYNKVNDLYYSDDYNVETMIRYLTAAAEYRKCFEAMKMAKNRFEDVDESIFGIDW